MKNRKVGSDTPAEGNFPESAQPGKIDFQDPEVVLSLLEADQVVAAKSRMHFARRKLSWGVELLLWGLRIYVVVMLVIVFLSVLRALHGLS